MRNIKMNALLILIIILVLTFCIADYCEHKRYIREYDKWIEELNEIARERVSVSQQVEAEIAKAAIAINSPVLTEPHTKAEPTVIEKTYQEFSDDDIALMARIVMNESSICAFDAKELVAITIINRVNSDKFPDTVYDVVHQSGAYSLIENGEVSPECFLAVQSALLASYPTDLFYFRDSYYHDFGTPYCHVDNLYFSRQ